MEDNIFDIEFSANGEKYVGWVNPSAELSADGKPTSFHVVLNGVSFVYVSHNNTNWVVNADRQIVNFIERRRIALNE